nr:hypothetical protein [Tanacetum cinerariifolium]
MQTNQFAEAISSILDIVDRYIDHQMNEAVKVVVQLQSDKLRDEAQVENEDFLNKLDENIQRIIKEQVKEQVKLTDLDPSVDLPEVLDAFSFGALVDSGSFPARLLLDPWSDPAKGSSSLSSSSRRFFNLELHLEACQTVPKLLLLQLHSSGDQGMDDGGRVGTVNRRGSTVVMIGTSTQGVDSKRESIPISGLGLSMFETN